MDVERQILIGALGQIEYRFKVWRSNDTGDLLEELSGVAESATIDMSNMRDHTWELTLPMEAVEGFDLFSEWVKITVRISAGGYSVRKPFGLYLFDVPRGSDTPMYQKWELTGKSPEARLMGSTYEKGYAVPAGTGAFAAIREILLEQGVPERMISLPSEDEDTPLPRGYFADPFQDSEGTRPLRVCNGLAASVGALALWADNDGALTSRKIRDSNAIETDITYGTVEDSDPMITSEEIPFEYDDENFANRVVVYSGDPAEAASYGVAENHDPNSRVSYENWGSWKQNEPISLPKLVSPAEAAKVARQALRRASGMNLVRSFETDFDTRIKPRQSYGMEVFGDDGRAIMTRAAWPVINVNCNLDLSPMTHEIHQGIHL